MRLAMHEGYVLLVTKKFFGTRCEPQTEILR